MGTPGPGGKIDPGETPLEAAVRELREETGLHLPALTLAGYARFRLTAPPRSEYAALYTARTTIRHENFTPNAEISAIHWWDTTLPHPENTQVLDTTLARRTHPRPPPHRNATGEAEQSRSSRKSRTTMPN